jgi:TctA family transporter
MGMIEGLVSGFFQAVSLDVFPFLLVGAVFGLLIGVIPGLSGHFAMAMVIPFLYTMDAAPGIAFLLGAHSTVAQGGGLTAISPGAANPGSAASRFVFRASRDFRSGNSGADIRRRAG